MTLVAQPISLTKQDRCDRCPAEAKVIAKSGGSELLFCDHHARNHEVALVNAGWSIIRP